MRTRNSHCDSKKVTKMFSTVKLYSLIFICIFILMATMNESQGSWMVPRNGICMKGYIYVLNKCRRFEYSY